MDTHQIARAADGVHNTQYRASKGLLDLIEGLLKAYKNKRKDEHRIEVKVDGKTKFKATVDKYGRMRATKNDLSPDEIRTLHNYFKSMPNPPINPKDFDVIVDGNKVLETKNGNVVKQAQPQQSNAFADTEWVAAPTAKVVDPRTVDSTVVDAIPMPSKPSAKPEDTANFEKSVDRWVATDRSKTAPTQFERTHAEPIPRKEQESQGRLDLNLDGTSQETPQPIDVPTTSADSAPLPVPAKKDSTVYR
ncbi:MAG: hypothetical protein HC852_07190 [Acaryochloridaceae cyanobacterium RU_4_10]|nr:hypothetical protein [Acaryochloridaceae cyanobacterium RU_4_10]